MPVMRPAPTAQYMASTQSSRTWSQSGKMATAAGVLIFLYWAKRQSIRASSWRSMIWLGRKAPSGASVRPMFTAQAAASANQASRGTSVNARSAAPPGELSSRWRMVTTWARLMAPPGEKLPLPVPVMMPLAQT